MTQTTAHAHAHINSSSSSSDLRHAQQRRRRQAPPLPLSLPLPLLTALLLLLLHCSAAAQLPSRFFYAAPQPAAALNDAAAEADGSCCQSDSSTLPLELALELSNVTSEYSQTESSADSSSESSKELVKRSVSRSIRKALPASCSPQPTIVELKPPTDEGTSAVNVFYSPSCTRVHRCSGCCGSTLISCQPTKKEIIQMRVNKVERTATSTKGGTAIVEVEQHLACTCDCRIKADDCNSYQRYRKDLCRCECQNFDARDKCLEQQEHKYWDDANCTCACRYNQSCTTGTVFDEAQCKCTDPTPSEPVDRKRFIVQAVAVEPDNSTLYSV